MDVLGGLWLLVFLLDVWFKVSSGSLNGVSCLYFGVPKRRRVACVYWGMTWDIDLLAPNSASYLPHHSQIFMGGLDFLEGDWVGLLGEVVSDGLYE